MVPRQHERQELQLCFLRRFCEDGRIDYDALAKQVAKVRPKLLVAGASAYPRAIDFEKLAEIAHGYGAMLMVDMAHIAGLVAGGMHQNRCPMLML